MAEISDYDLYDISDLVTTWQKGWRKLASLGCARCTKKPMYFPSNRSMSVLDLVSCVFYLILSQWRDLFGTFGLPEHGFLGYACQVMLNLAAEGETFIHRVSKSGFSGCLGAWAKDKGQEKKCLRRVLQAVETSGSLGEAFGKITTSANVDTLKRVWVQGGRKELSSLFSHEFSNRFRETAGWLKYGLSGRERCEEAFWNCTWFAMEPSVQKLLRIRDKIAAEVPLSDDEVEVLDFYLGYGRPRVCTVDNDNGKRQMQVILTPPPENTVSANPLVFMAVVLLVQPAFVLSQDLARSLSKPRFLRKCRAPSCGKLFWTGRANATNCPGSRSGQKNKCSLEWIRYMRYLKKVGKDPESDWDNGQLKRDFVKYDKS
jgi:hypothetical protein